MLSDRQNSSYAKSTVNSINIERVSKHSVTIRGLRVVTTCWYWAWSNLTSPSKWVGLGSLLAACSVYGDLTCSVHTVNNLCMFNCQCHFYLCNRGPYVRLAFVPNMLSSWNKDIIIFIKSWRKLYKIRLQRHLFETCNKWMKWQDISVDIKILSPGGCLPLPWGYIHV